MRKFLGYIFTPVYAVYFYVLLLIFHPIMDFGIKFISDKFRKRMIETLNWLLIKGLIIVGVRPKVNGKEKLPKDRPLIVVANHSSLLDIPPIVLVFKDYYPRFISKKELGHGIPSISHNLRYGGSALIDRESGAQAVKQILLLGRDIEKKKHAVCIYPEGTRSKNGKLKKFQSSGILTLLKTAPSAVIIPFVISGHYDLHKYGNYPLNFGAKVSYNILDPIEPKDFKDKKDIVPYVEKVIREALGQTKG